MKKNLKLFSNFKEFEKFILENRSKNKLHPVAENNLKILLKEIYPESHPISESNVDGGRVDLIFYLQPLNYNVHFEIIASKSRVTQDLRLLERSKSDIRIAILIDIKIDPSVSTEYFRKRPYNPFPSYKLSDIFLTSKIAEFKDNIKKIIKNFLKKLETNQKILFIEDIDWTLINPEKFEKIVYFILDEMGLKNITWSKGGIGASAYTNGRILECENYDFKTDGSVVIEKWMVNVRHSSNNLEMFTIEENLTEFRNIDAIGIVTNDMISTSTKNWISKVERKYPDKRIIKWDGDKLEKLIIGHPNLVYRFFPSSLTLNGRFNFLLLL